MKKSIFYVPSCNLSFIERDGKIIIQDDARTKLSRVVKDIDNIQEKKTKNSEGEPERIRYFLFSKGSFSFSFSTYNYSPAAAILRAEDLSKYFSLVELFIITDGVFEKMWPETSALKKRKKIKNFY